MKTFFTSIACGLVVVAATAQSLRAQQPIREGLRRTGEIAAEGTRRVVQGAADVTRGVVGGAAQGLRAGVDAITPNTPWQAQAGTNLQAADQGRDARWRFQQRNGEWWYYTPEGQWMYHRNGQWNTFAADSYQLPQQSVAPQLQSGEYAMGYRGVDQGQQSGVAQPGANFVQGPVHRLYVDSNGREYICENGRRVYVNTSQGTTSGYGANYGAPTPEIPVEGQSQGQFNGSVNQGGVQSGGQTYGDQGAAPAQPQTPGSEGASSPREINNQPPNPAATGDATTQGTGDGETLLQR